MSNDRNVVPGKECARLSEFRDFIIRAGENVGEGEEISNRRNAEVTRNCVTRSSTETYRVSGAERNAEIVHTLWTQLQLKGCPRDFQVKLMCTAQTQLEQEFRNAKECVENSGGAGEEPQYDLLKLQKFVINHLEKLLTNLTDNAEADHLQNFADKNALCAAMQIEKCQCHPRLPTYAVSQIKNKPRKMEDRHVCLERFSEMYQLPDRNYSLYGVFDGHSGVLSANYASSQIPQLLATILKDAKIDADTSLTNAGTDVYRHAFESAFLQADERFRSKRITSGTTAVCALIAHHQMRYQLFVAWVGDSKALLVGRKVSLQLVKAHKPDSLDERKRIEEMGGTVIHAQGHWRVNGVLNVARSIGDYSVEPVIAEPDFVDVELTDAHDFLVLGSDGLWDHVTESAVRTLVYAALADTERKFEDIPKLLIEAAKEGDSQDNITVIIILLKSRTRIVEKYNQL